MAAKKEDPKPKIAITMGDSRGIGPEVVAKAFVHGYPAGFCRPLVLGDVNVLARTVARMDLALRVIEVGEGAPEFRPGVLPVLPLSHLLPDQGPAEIAPQESSRASFAYVETAGRMALEGRVEAIVTAPVSKEAIHGAGIPFRGHTEYLAEISGRGKYAMMVAGERLKVTFVTTHVALRSVAGLLREEKILSVIEITGRGLRDYFNLSGPRIAVAALNPHAGEGGLFGEEEGIISRAVQRGRDLGLFVSGPWPADTLFFRAEQGEFDAVVCMYHDQGLIPLKLLHFDTAVNVTLGLPFIRTSVDHGVAYDIAGQGRANPSSMVEAIRLANAMARRKRDLQKS
jgi:4-hydroxythreonine-4-phosphate dehydrogenase